MSTLEIQGLSDQQYIDLRSSLDKEIEELEGKLNKITTILELRQRKEELIEEILEGISKINNDELDKEELNATEPEDEELNKKNTIISTRIDNIDDLHN